MDRSQYTGPTDTPEAEDRRDAVARAARAAVFDTIYAPSPVRTPRGARSRKPLDTCAREQATIGPEATCPGAVAGIARAMALEVALHDLGERSARSGISRTFGDFAQGTARTSSPSARTTSSSPATTGRVLLPDIENADEGGVHDADELRRRSPAGGDPGGAAAGKVSFSSARCRLRWDSLRSSAIGGHR
ncbi:hypothetical protein [Streptomyces sp. NPDC001070]